MIEVPDGGVQALVREQGLHLAHVAGGAVHRRGGGAAEIVRCDASRDVDVGAELIELDSKDARRSGLRRRGAGCVP